MAGIHQIWSLDLLSWRISVFAGTSREGIDDGPRRTMATLAQPSGLAADGETLYWVDPESSALRRVPVAGEGDVETLVGTGLFDYGDRDGRGKQAQFQHPQGVALLDDAVYVADTYNHRIRVYEPVSEEVGTAAGSERGWTDGVAGAARFDEPGGLSAAGGLLYIADTNNHLVRVYNPADGSVSTLTLTNLSAIATATPASDEGRPSAATSCARGDEPAGDDLHTSRVPPERFGAVEARPGDIERRGGGPGRTYSDVVFRREGGDVPGAGDRERRGGRDYRDGLGVLLPDGGGSALFCRHIRTEPACGGDASVVPIRGAGIV